MTAWYCSNTEPCFQIKGNRPRCLSELSIRLWPLQKEQCGKNRQHHNVCERPSQTRSTQHASFSNQRVMYSTTVTLFSQIDHYIQKPCAAAVVGTSRWDEKVHYSYITLAQMLSSLLLFLLFLLQMVITEYKCTSYKRVVNGYYIPFLSYSNILWSTSRHQWQQQQKYKVRTRHHTKRFSFFFLNFFVTLLKKTSLTSIRGCKLLFMLEMFAEASQNHFMIVR